MPWPHSVLCYSMLLVVMHRRHYTDVLSRDGEEGRRGGGMVLYARQ